MYKTTSVASVLLLLSTLGANSADVTVIDSGRFDWSGGYVGVHGGVGAAQYEGLFDGEGNPSNPNAGYAQDLDLDGGVFGLHAGYNVQSGNWVYGIEGDITFTNWDDLTLERNLSNFDYISGEVGFLGSIRARAGIAGDRTLIFATGGLAFASASYTAYDGPIGNPTSQGTIDFNDLGLAVGGGAEYAISDNLILRIEGIYYSFGDRQDGSGLNTDSDAGDFAEFVSAYTVRGGISYKF